MANPPYFAKAVGKVAALERRVSQENPLGSVGIAHTRWATHGKPTEAKRGENLADMAALAATPPTLCPLNGA